MDVGYEFTTGTIDWWCFNMNWAWDSVGKTAPEGTDLDDQGWRATQLGLIHLTPSPIRIQIMKHHYFYFEWSPWQSFRHFWHSIWNSISPGWWLTYPSEKSWTNRQLGWWHSIPNWMESHIAAMFQTTNQPHFLASFLASIQGDEEEGVAPFLKPRDPYLAVPRWGNMGK